MPLGSEKVGLMAASAAAAGAVGNFAGGIGGSTKVIDTINISSLGDATDHGDLSVVKGASGTADSGTNGRGTCASKWSGVNQIDYWTIDSKGDASDFGELTIGRWYVGSVSNATNNRGVYAGGDAGPPYPVPGYSGVIDYVNISSPANAVDFGDLPSGARTQTSGVDNGTNDRGLWMGGWTPGAESNIISYITITSLGDASDFGDLTNETYSMQGLSNATGEKGCASGGAEGTPTATITNKIEAITINSLGNATDFGNLTNSRASGAQGADNGVDDRGVFGGGSNGATMHNTLDYITITSAGNAADFGDLTSASASEKPSGCSNGAT